MRPLRSLLIQCYHFDNGHLQNRVKLPNISKKRTPRIQAALETQRKVLNRHLSLLWKSLSAGFRKGGLSFVMQPWVVSALVVVDRRGYRE